MPVFFYGPPRKKVKKKGSPKTTFCPKFYHKNLTY